MDGKAASSHTHTSNQVTALTSYSKGTSAAALATTDTLNAALGKLENKADNAASAAATAVQPGDLADVATSGDFDDLTNVPSKLSYFLDDIGAGAAHYYGSGVGAATTATKSVQIDSISLNSSTNLPAVGTVIVVIPATTSNVVNPTLTLKSGTNNGVAKAIKYNNSTSITAVNSGKIWQAGVPSTFVYLLGMVERIAKVLVYLLVEQQYLTAVFAA